MSRRPLFLHIGCGKSGTTSLQQALYASVPQLLAQGVGLPLPSREEALPATFRPLASLMPGEPIPRRVRTRMTELSKRLRRAEGDRLLITLEDLCELSEAGVALLVDALGDFDVHVVITARDWSKQIPSDWQELVKQRLLLSYPDFVQAVRDGAPEAWMFRLRQHVPEIAQRWATRVPADRIHIVPVPPPVPDPTRVFQLVGGVVGFDATTLDVPPGLRNQSLGYEQAETLRRVSVALGERLPDGRREFRPSAKAVLFHRLRAQKGTALRLPPEHMAWCHEYGAEMLAQLRASGYDIVGNPEDLVSVVDESAPELPEVTDADVADTATKALADLLDAHHLRAVQERRAAAGKHASPVA